MEKDGVEFREALKILADFAGIELESGQSGQSSHHQVYYDLNSKVLNLYSDYLQSHDGIGYLKYLQDRGVTQNSIQTFLLGACPDEWNFLSNQLTDECEKLEKLGLIRKSNQKGKYGYDFFRDRIMFPILDSAGRVVGFGGRAFQENRPDGQKNAKYMNSSESLVFHKSKILYGLYQAIAEIRKNRFAYISEGYMDVIGLFQAGFKNSCAPLGTAITSEHFKTLGRYTNHFVSIFDGDQAGRNAAVKFARMAVDFSDLTCEILLLPDGYDAMDMSQKYSSSILEDIFASRIPAGRFLLVESMFGDSIKDLLKKDYINSNSGNLETSRYVMQFYLGERPELFPVNMQTRRDALNRLYELLLQIPGEIERTFFIDEAAQLLKLNSADLKREFQKNHQRPDSLYKKNQTRENKNAPGQVAGQSGQSSVPITQELKEFFVLERQLMVQILSHPKLAGKFLKKLQVLNFMDLHSEILWRYLEGLYFAGNTWMIDDLAQFEIPVETLSMFDLFLLDLKYEIGNLNQSELVVNELLMKHSLLEIKKEIAQLDARQHVADSVENSSILEKREELKIKLKQIQAAIRGNKNNLD